ncbi:hypothetical protein J7E62_32820 [Variovorax paradoxus]|nr:hypothetical protein [Variovorax paradoxus]
MSLKNVLSGFSIAIMAIAPVYAKRADDAVVAARQKVFGVENVDAETGKLPGDKVIFSWLSNSSFAASIQGRVVFLDTYVTRLEVQPGRTPFVIKDMVDLKPEAILLGMVFKTPLATRSDSQIAGV